MPAETVYARADDDLFAAAVVTSTVAPLTSYLLTTLQAVNPAARVRFGVGTVTITWTLASPVRGDIFVLPASNLDPNVSPPVAMLTNGSGLAVSLTPPALPPNNIPTTLVEDLTISEPSAATRTASVWNLIITGNSVNVNLGGCVLLYGPKRILDPDIQWGFSVGKVHAVLDVRNEYLTRYRYNYQTLERFLEVTARVPGSVIADWSDWYDACAGSGLTGFLWPVTGIVSGLDAYVGTWQERFTMTNVEGADYYDIPLTFEELSKGQPF